jgi:hypothetical protein
MKIKDILMENYTAYVLDDASRNTLSQKFPPKYPKFVGHHVTIQFGVPKDTEVPAPAQIKVIGYTDSGDGLEALVVSVDGQTERPDGKRYHITWSLDPAKYSPVDSNMLLANNKFTLVRAIPINTNPELLPD